MTARAPSQAALMRAAKVAAAEGVCILIRAGELTWEVKPVAKPEESPQPQPVKRWKTG